MAALAKVKVGKVLVGFDENGIAGQTWFSVAQMKNLQDSNTMEGAGYKCASDGFMERKQNIHLNVSLPTWGLGRVENLSTEKITTETISCRIAGGQRASSKEIISVRAY